MKHSFLLLGLAAAALHAPLLAQTIEVSYTIDPTRDTARISPYIYGSNGQSDDRDENITARRAGGNRWSGYNWENNASNAGEDYINHSDDYLSYLLPDSIRNLPAAAAIGFHNESIATGCYSLVTLQAIGYVAADMNGVVEGGQTAPSSRWKEVRFTKGSPFSLQPDPNDGYVYMDEEVNYLVNRYGNASTANGIKGYSIDNEPALWPSTHPRIHPQKPSVEEIIDRGVGLARAVKSVDPHAEIFGPASFGYSEFLNFQDAPDWNLYSGYGTFINAYLAKMKDAENTEGKRLLDVLDIHWYPEATGLNNNGQPVRIALNPNVDPGVAVARMQAPRTLWDSSYTETSWIGQYFSPVALLPAMNASIARYYPGTKLAFTEFNYGGVKHISGGIAMADVLGIFGRYGVYMGTHWEALEGYVSSAYKIYRNYDGAQSTFGDLGVRATASDNENSSVYGSISSGSDTKLHMVVMNKNMTRPIAGSFTIAGDGLYRRAHIYAFDAADSTVRLVDSIESIGGNFFSYTIPPLTVAHIVVEKQGGASGVGTAAAGGSLQLGQNHPNPFAGVTTIAFSLPSDEDVTLRVTDPMGREVARLIDGRRSAGNYAVPFDAGGLPTGQYFYQLRAGGSIVTRGMTLIR